MRSLSLPIQDCDFPECDAPARQLIAELASAIERGLSVLIHCRQRIGRAGMIAASVLISAGIPVGDALQNVSAARGLDVPKTPLNWPG